MEMALLQQLFTPMPNTGANLLSIARFRQAKFAGNRFISSIAIYGFEMSDACATARARSSVP